MSGKLLAKIKRMMGERESFDPGRFGDPVAARTDWGPATKRGTNFHTHELVVVNPDRLELKASAGALFFYGTFLFVGLGMLVTALVSVIARGGESFWKQEFGGVLFGLIFGCPGALLVRSGTVPVVFDRRKGCFWKGRKSPDEVLDPGRIRHFAAFADIHAIQFLSVYCGSGSGSDTRYELNLVLEDGRRINVVNHVDETRFQEDAKTVSSFVGRPIWDAT